jgi:glucose/arabinose dehydrogenase
MAFEPSSGALWTVVNERDEIGEDVPPDYLRSVQDGGFYGWPYSYWGKTVDERLQPPIDVLTGFLRTTAAGWHSVGQSECPSTESGALL